MNTRNEGRADRDNDLEVVGVQGTAKAEPAESPDTRVCSSQSGAARANGQAPRRLPVPNWRPIALDVVDIAAAAGSLQGAMAETMTLLQDRLGFDTGSLVSRSSNWMVSWNKPESCERLWNQRGPMYLQELSGFVHAALGPTGVVQDTEVLPPGVRERAAFYDEYMRPIGGGCLLTVGLITPSGEYGLTVNRHGRGRFHDAERDLLRHLRAVLTLAVRGLVAPAPQLLVPTHPVAGKLTAREQEFSGYVARGLTNREIADLCGCSQHTVRNRLAVVFRKLEVTTRAELAALIAAEQSLSLAGATG